MEKVIYKVNGVASNIWRRLAASKTFWVCAVFMLAAAERWNKGEIALTELIQVVEVGVIGILIRSALAKAELAANAGNPDIEHVEAVTAKKTGTAGKLGLFLAALMFVVMLPVLAGCTAGSKLGEVLTNPDGKPVVTGTICVNTPNGRFCYVPDTKTIVEPETVPDGVAAAPVVEPAPVAPYGAPIMAAPTPLPQLAK